MSRPRITARRAYGWLGEAGGVVVTCWGCGQRTTTTRSDVARIKVTHVCKGGTDER